MQIPEGSIKIQTHEGEAIIQLSGALNVTLSEHLRTIINKITPPVTINFEQTPYMTAEGLQVLLEFYKTHHAPPTLVGANALIQRLIKMTGMERYVRLDHKNDHSEL
ncbi:STAS domain-containing protein [Thiofilum flexile]|uniref:STAS domain-containing protein n=1 Tax=Thiofilum flexile TaxID=125627 RepID=UPI00037465B3|nr:STAS domain-containing protein [Thiofilum flexile]